MAKIKKTTLIFIGLALFGAYRLFAKKNPEKPTNNYPNKQSSTQNNSEQPKQETPIVRVNPAQGTITIERNLKQEQIDELLDEFRLLQYSSNEQTIIKLLENATFEDFKEIQKQSVKKQIIHPKFIPTDFPYELLSMVTDRSPELLNYLKNKYPKL